MENLIESVIADLTQAKDQLIRVLDNTPDDRINWSPAPTARTPIQIVAHCGFSLGFMSDMFDGTPYPAPTMAEADAEFWEIEREFTTRAKVLDHLESNYSKVVATLRNLDKNNPDKLVKLPFGMGEAPMHYMLVFPALHTRTHTAQLEYLQTIYGDRKW